MLDVKEKKNSSLSNSCKRIILFYLMDIIDGRPWKKKNMCVMVKVLGSKTTVKIRGRIFFNPEKMMQINIWDISKYILRSLLII